MSPRRLYDLLSALHMLHSGRAHEGTEALADAIREHGRVPVHPPVWMQQSLVAVMREKDHG